MKDINNTELRVGDKVLLQKVGWLGSFGDVKDGCDGEIYSAGDSWIQIKLNCNSIRKYYKIMDKDDNPPTLWKIED